MKPEPYSKLKETLSLVASKPRRSAKRERRADHRGPEAQGGGKLIPLPLPPEPWRQLSLPIGFYLERQDGASRRPVAGPHCGGCGGWAYGAFGAGQHAPGCRGGDAPIKGRAGRPEYAAASSAVQLVMPEVIEPGHPVAIANTPLAEAVAQRAGAAGTRSMIEFTFSCKICNPLNGSQGMTRGAMFAAAAERKRQRRDVAMHMQANGAGELPKAGRFQIDITRIAGGRFDDDNLRAACKSLRDGIADCLGFRHDRDPRLEWRYGQELGRKRNVKKGIAPQHDVRVRVEVMP